MSKLIEGQDYIIKDNFFDKEYFNNLRTTVMDEDSFFPWYFEGSIAMANDDKNLDSYFYHLVYSNGKSNSSFYDSTFSVLHDYLNIKELIRIKANCYPSTEKLTIHSRHRDYDFSHKGALIYLNDTDGYTILEDNTRVESVANRVLFFDAHNWHSSTNCTNQKARFNININYF